MFRERDEGVFLRKKRNSVRQRMYSLFRSIKLLDLEFHLEYSTGSEAICPSYYFFDL